ncbi:MAG: hypothetical protein JNL60_12190 [Bacteroidia bacterium]|nr:hypothetical protein [Bacteroidia bacterium]
MKTGRKIESYMSMIEKINYENVHGGAYAYVQFMAYSRELVKLLKPFKKVEPQINTIEGVSWLFNEYLAARFTPRQKVIFETKMVELKEVFDYIRFSLRQFEREFPVSGRMLHRQAA